MRRRGNLPYEIYLYTGLDMLMAREKPNTTKLLAIAESQFSDAVENAGFTDVLLLNESSTYMEKPENMSKYQSVEHICAKIQQLCMSSEEEALPQSVRHGSPMKLIGIYTPVTRCLQTTFSICMGQLLARKAPVVYLNFEAYSGMEIMLDRSFQ